KVPVTPGTSYQFDLTPFDLANMCGIPQEEQGFCLNTFIKDPRVKLNANKIYISDCAELVKTASYYRKQKH
ncbi:MAG TPA: cAMP-binding protein, partial [Treponemataceae bacterium]|nr:cAMP-binding protein [Treponemataceae bacterium]